MFGEEKVLFFFVVTLPLIHSHLAILTNKTFKNLVKLLVSSLPALNPSGSAIFFSENDD